MLDIQEFKDFCQLKSSFRNLRIIAKKIKDIQIPWDSRYSDVKSFQDS